MREKFSYNEFLDLIEKSEWQAARHLLCAVLAHADSVTVAAAPDGKCADVFFLIPGSFIHREKGTR